MLGTIIAGCAIGGIAYSCKEIYKTLLLKNLGENNSIISKDVWDNIWYYNKIFIKIDEDEIKVPTLIGTEPIKYGVKYIFNIPLGITTKDIERCKIQIRELTDASEVEIAHCKGNIIHINVSTYEDIESFTGSIENDKWNELWKELELVTGNLNDGYKYPQLVCENKIAGGISHIFQMPIGKSSSHVLKHDTTIKEFLEAREIEITSLDKNKIEIKAIYDELPRFIPFELYPRTSDDSFEIPIGKFIDGYAVLDFKKVANVLDAGMQGSGKSVVTKWALTYLGCMYSPKELEIYISDLKRTELNRFKNMKHVKWYVDTPSGTDIMIKNLIKIIDERYKKFAEAKVSDIYEYNEKYPEDKMPYIFVAIEEMSRFTSNAYVKSYYTSKNLNTDQNYNLSELLFNARASGLSLWCTVQRPTKENLNPDVKSSLGNTLAFKTMNALNSKIICDDDDKLKYLRGKGHGYLITDGVQKEFQSFYITNDEIEQLLEDKDLLKEDEFLFNKDSKEDIVAV